MNIFKTDIKSELSVRLSNYNHSTIFSLKKGSQKTLESNKIKKSGQRRLRIETNVHHLEVQAQKPQENSSKSINPTDLAVLVGLPFSSGLNQSFFVDSTNSKGETVGTAYFKSPDPKIGSREQIAWQWSAENGFQIITTQTELLNAYDKKREANPFQFYKLVINDSGVVAGSFLVDQNSQNVCPQFWWSLEKGLNLSEIPDNCQIVKDINNNGEIAISIINNSGLVYNINNNKYYRIEYPSKELIKEKIEPYIPIMPGEANALKKLNNWAFHLASINIHTIDEQSRVHGDARVLLHHKKDPTRHISVIVNFSAVPNSVDASYRLENVYALELKDTQTGKIIYSENDSEITDQKNKSLEIPQWVLFVYAKYKDLPDAINRNPGDALILLKYHLFRPDEHGQNCIQALESRMKCPIELIKICLPNKKYLKENSRLLDLLYKSALKSGNAEYANFFLYPEQVINCPERDAYFIEWYNYELRRLGKEEHENLLDFLKRKPVNQYLKALVQKLPSELRPLLQHGLSDKNRYWESWGLQNFETAYAAIKYNICPSLYYWEVQPNKGIWHDSFSCLISRYGRSGDSRVLELMPILFPSNELREQHPENLTEFLDHTVWEIYHIAKVNEKTALEMLQFLKNAGIDLHAIAQKSKHREIPIFLRKYGWD